MLLSLFAAPDLARATEPGASGAHPVAAEPHAAPVLHERWYGWQSLSTDGAALLLLIAAGASSDQRNHLPDVLAYGAVGMYLLGGPVTHFAHDNPGRGLGSLALRAGLPIAFGALGYNLEDCSGDENYDLCGFPGALVGGVLGIGSAIAIDAAALGFEEVQVEREGVTDLGVSIGRDHAALVAGGKF